MNMTQFAKFQFVELIMGALLYGASPVCALCAVKQLGHLNVRGVSVTMFRERDCTLCAVKAAVPIMKRRGPRGHAFPVLLSYEHLAKARGLVFVGYAQKG